MIGWTRRDGMLMRRQLLSISGLVASIAVALLLDSVAQRVSAESGAAKASKVTAKTSPQAEQLTANRQTPLPEQTTSGSLAGQYCDAARDAAGEMRYAVQSAHLDSLLRTLEERMARLETKKEELQDWMAKRQAYMVRASDQLVGIFAAMRAEAASGLLARLDPGTAAAVLSKLDHRSASAILSGMPPDKAGRLTTILASVARKSDTDVRP